MSAKESIKDVLNEGIRQGQAETGQPQIPITKKDREAAAAQVVAAWYVKLFHLVTLRGWK